ncbi:hypothetical protein [Mycoplasma suis]|uniref:Uncharacterized protein n=1 Tax=Mycoplasma suis (strain Illinois) TaxID=768700 RepID=F0QRF7_MYCSL|nr:hypothetical protein [Mycoplasma suis]ADX98077.1 hypothetical protein MSU_0544 [Mycoplasma suis str. Illinois]
MFKKLLATFIGATGVFGFSIEKHLNIFSSGDVIPKPSAGGGGHRKFSLPFQVDANEVKKNERESFTSRRSKERKSSLQNYWFNQWEAKSEGSSDPIYLVNKEGQVKEIEASLHGQKQRFMWDGIFIDRVNSWFGSRRIPFTDENSPDYKKVLGDLKLLDLWAKLKKGFLSQNPEELRSLSQWFEKLSDPEKCQIIDVVIDCDKFKSSISLNGSATSIGSNFKIHFDNLHKLASKRWDSRLPKFAELIGYRGIIYISKLQGFEDKFGNILDIWLQEEVNKELKKVSNGLEKINGIQFIRSLVTGKKFADGCEKYSENEEHKKIFGECFATSSEDFSSYKKISGERNFVPKVIDVIKAGQMLKDPMYAPPKYSLVGDKWIVTGEDYKKWKAVTPEMRQEVVKGYEDVGGWKGIIDASCSRVTASGWWSSFISLISKTPLEKMGCWEFYNLFFSKERFEDKRWCLFQIPETSSFVKETNIFGPFYLSNWNKGNQFWAKCDLYGL